MAHPKRRQSSTRQAKRRTHDKAVDPRWEALLQLKAKGEE